MNSPQTHHATEQESRQLAETSRQKEWKPSFMRELFLGRFRYDMISPFPMTPERPEYTEFLRDLRDLLIQKVDPVEIDESGEIPQEIMDALNALCAFGMNIPKEYGGLGLTKVEFCRAMELVCSYEGSLLGVLSPHQSVGVPECLKLFGTEEQKRKYLPRCAAGEISAFALTELDVGSDPARLTTRAERSEDGQSYVLNGKKLWCTNGTIAKLLVVMARHRGSNKLSAFVVETDWEGVRVEQRCRFMGLKALANGVISFTDVRVPKENLIGEEGAGLRIALTALTNGRLAIPAGSLGVAKTCLTIARKWSRERVQWGKPIGEHEAVGKKIADMAAAIFAMESILLFCCEMADRGDMDLRLEAAATKDWMTNRQWELLDDTMQIRGGRGYETERSLAFRGETPMPVERFMRDTRVYRIFEGASEIMHLLIAREAVDKHLQVASALVRPEAKLREKIGCLPGVVKFYAGWYPRQWFGWGHWPKYQDRRPFAAHLRFIDRATRKLARQIFPAMLIHRAGLERKQGFLFRWVDIAIELFTMAASISRAERLRFEKDSNAESAARLADLHCRNARIRVRRLFRELWRSQDGFRYRVAREILDGQHLWLEEGAIGLDGAAARDAVAQVTEPAEV